MPTVYWVLMSSSKLPTDSDHHTRLTMRLRRAQSLFRDGDDFLIRVAVDEMIDRLAGVERHFDQALALFGHTDYLVHALQSSERVGAAQRLEMSDIPSADNFGLAAQSYDLILAPLTLHFLQDLPGAFVQMRRALRPDGLLLAVLPGPETLNELRASLLFAESAVRGGAAQRVDAFTDIRDAGSLLQRSGFALPVLDTDTLTVRYDSLLELIMDLRRMGAAGLSTGATGPVLNRAIVAAALEHYATEFSDPDGRVRASFQCVSLSGWAPHESQQKPLKPGSAKQRLADALKVDEKKF